MSVCLMNMINVKLLEYPLIMWIKKKKYIFLNHEPYHSASDKSSIQSYVINGSFTDILLPKGPEERSLLHFKLHKTP